MTCPYLGHAQHSCLIYLLKLHITVFIFINLFKSEILNNLSYSSYSCHTGNGVWADIQDNIPQTQLFIPPEENGNALNPALSGFYMFWTMVILLQVSSPTNYPTFALIPYICIE